MNTDKHGSLLEKKYQKRKNTNLVSNIPARRVDSYTQDIPEIPPSPPFLKGG
jgi:hypothetical protein